VAFFFPWAVVFGKANSLAKEELNENERQAITAQLLPPRKTDAQSEVISRPEVLTEQQGSQLAWIAFWDILVFFGVILVGFAYLWKRGDLDWVRSLSAERVVVGKEI